MKEDHEHMPGMSKQPEKPKQGKTSEGPPKAGKSTQSDASAQPDKAKAQPTPGKS